MEAVEEENKGYTYAKDDQVNEATVYLNGSPVYKFGTNPKWAPEEFNNTFEHHCNNLSRQLIIR